MTTAPEPLTPHNTTDQSPVLLARIEGKLDLILFQVTDHAGRIKNVESDVRNLASETQLLASEAKARDLTVEATAKALREAKESEEAATRAEMARSEQTWTPIARSLAILAVVTSLLSLYLITRP